MKGSIGSTCAIAGLFLFGGCGSDGPTVVDEGDYATAVCASIVDWGEAMKGPGEDLADSLDRDMEPEDSKKLLEGYLSDAADATDDLVAAVTGAGVPDMDGGADVARSLQDAMGAMRDGWKRLAEDAGDLPTEDLSEFQAAVRELKDPLTTTLDDFESALEDDDDLVELFESTDCEIDVPTPEDFRDTAEEAILGQGADSAECDVPTDTEVGTTFSCVATFGDSPEQQLEATIGRGGEVTIR